MMGGCSEEMKLEVKSGNLIFGKDRTAPELNAKQLSHVQGGRGGNGRGMEGPSGDGEMDKRRHISYMGRWVKGQK